MAAKARGIREGFAAEDAAGRVPHNEQAEDLELERAVPLDVTARACCCPARPVVTVGNAADR
jgi:hypothetical protein